MFLMALAGNVSTDEGNFVTIFAATNESGRDGLKTNSG
jgi:hypothetical protein